MDRAFILRYVLFGIAFFDYLGIRYDAWSSPSDFPLLPGDVPLEHVMWCGFMIVLILAVNQHFFSTSVTVPPAPRNRLIVKAVMFGGLVVALLPPAHPLIADYVYLKIGLFLYPVVLFLALRTNRALARELALTLMVFVPFNLAFEVLAIHNGYWSFSGVYLGWVAFAGQRFPIEELVFTVLLLAPAIVATHALRANWRAAGRSTRGLARARPYLELGKFRIVELGMGVPLAWSLVPDDALSTRTLALCGLALVIVLASSAAALAFDDVAGFHDGVDAINHPDGDHRVGVKKPLVAGTLTVEQARTFARLMLTLAVAAASVGVVLAPPDLWWFVIVGGMVIAAAINYSIGARLSYRGGHELVTFTALAGTVALPYVLITSELSTTAGLHAILVGLWMLLISLFSNLVDSFGDRAVNRLTIAACRSTRANALLIVAVAVAGWATWVGAVASGAVPPWTLIALLMVGALQVRQLHAGLWQRRWLTARARGFWVFRVGIATLFVCNVIANGTLA